MISLGRLLSHRPASAVGPLRQLLAGISRTAVQTGTPAREIFQQQIESAAERITAEAAEAALEAEVAAIVQSLSRYNTAVEQRSAAQQQELRRMISAGLETVAAVGAASKTGIQQMRALEAKLESASEVEDLRLLRGKLLGCLTLVRNETVRMQMESRLLVRTLEASTLRASAELNAGTDATTGLPGPLALQTALRGDGQTRGERILAIFVVNEVAAINARFGRAAGDEVLRRASEILVEALSAQGSIHRWNGPAFVLAPKLSADADQVRANCRAISGGAFTIPITMEGKPASLSVSLSSRVQTLRSGELSEAACRELDSFVAEHSCAKQQQRVKA